ncbi:MAG: stage II sporulation protein R [Clostridia bacterium]|nr:stage II sporulation protein R [Clostridia bacterium]
MKFLVGFTCLALIIGIFSSSLPVNGEIGLYESVARLHVLANSDSEEDQALKLKVRDSILDQMEDSMKNCTTVEDAKKSLEESKDEILNTAKNCINSLGYDYDVVVELGEEQYPTRVYENVSLPAGAYYSVRVKIGEGEGKNWWCVLFPPLCVSSAIADNSDELASVGLTPNEVNILTNSEEPEYEIKFKFLEFLQKTFA